MEIASKYDPSKVEDKWYKYWNENNFFRSVPDEREPYCIVIPPPNVTGVLHMGHMLNNTIQDIFDTPCTDAWQKCLCGFREPIMLLLPPKPGWLHKLKEEGIRKSIFHAKSS